MVWGQKGSPLRSKVCNLQNKALRTMYFAKIFDRTKPLFALSHILQFSDAILLENLLFSHAFVIKCLPSSFNNFFSLSNESHYYETRRTAKVYFKVNMVNTTKYGLNSIKDLCIKSWNALLHDYPTIDFQLTKKSKLINLIKKQLFCSYDTI